MRTPNDVIRARAAIRAAIGDAALAEVHRSAWYWDAAGVIGIWSTILGCAWYLATAAIGPLWGIVFLLQGFAQQLLILLFHDACLHRRAFGERWNWRMSCFLTMPMFVRPTAYEIFHLEHHRQVGTDLDTEAFKQDVNTRGKRWALITIVGYLVQRRWPLREHLITPRFRQLLRYESRMQQIVGIAFLVGLFLWPRVIGLGYILPLLVAMPLASVTRIILEHAEANPENPFHLATFYRTGFLTRVLFLWDSGDCHLIHHLYGTIPFYRIGRAIELMRPTLLAQGVVERRSLLLLFWGYFVQNFPHRSLWFTKSNEPSLEAQRSVP